jgi:DNA-binding CsgD family transcriptional regulator
MSACQTDLAPHMQTATVRWTPQHVPVGQTCALSQILGVLAGGDDVRTVRRMLALLRVEIGAASAVAQEYVLHGSVLKLRAQIADETSAPYPNPESSESIVDPAHGHLVDLARSMHGDAMFCQHGPGGHISVLYALMANSAWALHFAPAAVGEPLRDDAMSRLGPLALLMRELHRIVAPTETTADERVGNAAIRLGVRATALSIRERQICARIAGGHSTTAIAAELGIASSTVMTLRKRAYAKLGIHGRLDLQQLAA